MTNHRTGTRDEWLVARLEPREAEGVAITCPGISASRLNEIAEELDTLSRSADPDRVQQRADYLILQKEIGVSARDCSELYNAAEMLTARCTGAPVSCHCRHCFNIRSMTQSVIGLIKPVRSAIGMKAAGASSPRFG